MDKFWNEDVWLPPNTTWEDLAPGPDKGVVYTDYRHLLIPIPLALLFIIFRRALEKFWFAPFGKSLGIKNTRPKKAPNNPKLEAVYQASPKIKHKQRLHNHEVPIIIGKWNYYLEFVSLSGKSGAIYARGSEFKDGIEWSVSRMRVLGELTVREKQEYTAGGNEVNGAMPVMYSGKRVSLRTRLAIRYGVPVSRKKTRFDLKKMIYHRDMKARVHACVKAMVKINESHNESLPHPPHSPDPSPSAFRQLSKPETILPALVKRTLRRA
ncbi:Ceramide synthase 3 [Eumeta japonica]|uniref:Ceramide synthase 3 n=1 Tax=Eumeta variegata TaxID=151549 RepID=A0A4C1W6P2_EUMVA|nr:Ceramide synthase 3 [Eumeta japonica]